MRLTTTQLNSYAVAIVDVLVPIVTVVAPPVQQAVAANPIAATGVAFALAVWNHTAVPFWKAHQPQTK